MKKRTPYSFQPNHSFWRRSVESIEWEAVDPVVDFHLNITNETKIATAGSCFAQHIARHLTSAGFNYLVTETGHPILPESVKRDYNYGLFSARYGNIYTAAQLTQLLERAYGEFLPIEEDWQLVNGRWVDAFRPNIVKNGFLTRDELREDRAFHLSSVRKIFENAEVFIFTLGLTEAWRSREDGAVFPICPGVNGGSFDELKHEFVNFSCQEIVHQLETFIKKVRSVSNTGCKFVITVSPVPLMATASDQHVLVATSLSKAILRVAADIICKKFENVFYFPSYEIITGPHTRGRYFGKNLRDIDEAGVSNVMRLFFKHAAGMDYKISRSTSKASSDLSDTAHFELGKNLIAVLCDEELLDAPS